MTKTCGKCGEEKPLTSQYWHKNKRSSDGFKSSCKSCIQVQSRNRMRKIRKENPDYSKNNMKKFRENNPDYNKTYLKEWRKKNPENVKKSRQKWLENNPEYRKEYVKNNKERIYAINQKAHKKKWKNNEVYRLRIRTRDLVNKCFLTNNTVKTSKTFEILGCDVKFFKEYLEKQFDDRMNWDNHGQFGWHLDHIIPISSAQTEQDVYRLNHYTNFQPLWWDDNLQKSNKISQEFGNVLVD